jgi:hypothetical protein
MRRSAVLVLASLLTFTGLAKAAPLPAGAPSLAAPALEPLVPVPPPADDRALTTTQWYAGKLVLVDLLSVGLVFAGTQIPTAPIGLGGYVLGAPLVHLGQGNGMGAGISLGLRLTLPIVGAVVAGKLHERGDNGGDCDCMGGLFAALGGMVLGSFTAMVADWIFLGHKTVTTRPREYAFVPTLMVGERGGSLGLAGRF